MILVHDLKDDISTTNEIKHLVLLLIQKWGSLSYRKISVAYQTPHLS